MAQPADLKLRRFETGCMVIIGVIFAIGIIAVGMTLFQAKDLSLLEAVNRRDPQAVERLLKQGMDPLEKFGREESPYDVAKRMGDRKTLEVLERYLAARDKDLGLRPAR